MAYPSEVIVTLKRRESSDEGTFGTLIVPNGDLLEYFFTGELPWRDNAPSVSCIPPGRYPCAWTFSQRFKRKMYVVMDVKDRAGIRIHSANLMGDATKGYKAQLNGCIALGERLGWIENQRALLVSASAIRRFETLMHGRHFTLEIL